MAEDRRWWKQMFFLCGKALVHVAQDTDKNTCVLWSATLRDYKIRFGKTYIIIYLLNVKIYFNFSMVCLAV